MILDFFINFLHELWTLTREMAPYLLFGFLFAGILRVFFPRRLLLKYMGKPNLKSVFNSALLGVPMPLCSCGVLPTGLSLRHNGASKGATNAFLISTPQTGVDSILVTYSMLGLPFAIIRPIVALLTGVAGGAVTNWLTREKQQDQASPFTHDDNPPRSLKYMFHYAFVEFLQDISKWLVVGLLIAAAISVILPDDFFSAWIPNDFAGMLIILLAAVPVYFCATASVPIAAVLLMKGLSPGAALVLLMAGPAVNSASFTVLFKSFGKKETWIYILTIVGGALLFGNIINLMPREWFMILDSSSHHHHGLIPEWLGTASAITLTLLVFNALLRPYLSTHLKPTKTMPVSENHQLITIAVNGMDCNHCKNSVETNLVKLDNIEEVIANLQNQTVQLKGTNIDLAQVKSTLDNLGYSYEGEILER
jgi:uncharacterized protein